MTISVFRGRRTPTIQGLITGAAAVVLSVGLQATAFASTVTLCPSSAQQGGFGNNFAATPGPLDGSCGGNSAVTMSITDAQNYAKLTFSPATSGYPTGLTLGGIAGIHSDVVVNTATTVPFYQLAFVTGNTSLGQSAASNQILFIEFQALTVLGGNMDLDPTTTFFNLYDNTTGQYLQGGQQDARSLNAWFSNYSFLSGTVVDELRIGIGLGGTSGPPQSLTVNSVAINQADVPEPASLALVGLALGAAGFAGRRRSQQRA